MDSMHPFPKKNGIQLGLVFVISLKLNDYGRWLTGWLVNRTLLLLIPKVDRHETVQQFRPISLCMVLYKIVAKVIINHLNPFLLEWYCQIKLFLFLRGISTTI
ncbi:hypothetical protein ES332_A07G065000v1 [Gossypium tomentosum]|uniref:Reverse transcriptase domain-containing protein n=1 Tax=Gossypium tomentosum TaxID=34277 RepID=A0A5D2PS56_GOSTO|nr:hypothetical protein ES332_A07G065000v1 [Gossypium tomentosum]